MKSFIQFSESLSSPLPYNYEFVNGRSKIHQYTFNVNDKKYVVQFRKIDPRFLPPFLQSYNVLDFGFFTSDNEFGTTGTGDEFKIFSTVIDTAMNVLTKDKIDILLFNADKGINYPGPQSNIRSRIYKRMLDKNIPSNFDYSIMNFNDRDSFIIYNTDDVDINDIKIFKDSL